MQPLMRDATTVLLRAVRERFGTFTGLTVDRIASRSWASATFTGSRHDLDLRLEGEGAEAKADAFLEQLDEAEFQLRGHILADIKLIAQRRHRGLAGMVVMLSLEALTVEDC